MIPGFCPELPGIFPLPDHGGEGRLDGGQVLLVGHAVPAALGGEDADRPPALGDEAAGHGGEEELPLQRVVVPPQKHRELVPEQIQNVPLEPPQVHGHHGVRRQMHVGLAVLGVRRAVGPGLDVGALRDPHQVAVAVHLADAPGDIPALRQRAGEGVAHHGVFRPRPGLAEEGADGLHGLPAVVVVGVDDGEGAVDLPGGAQDGLPCAPGLGPPGGDGEALRELVQGLVCAGQGHVGADMAPEAILKIPGHLLLDDADDLSEAGADGVIDGVVHDEVSAVVHRRHLLQTAEAASHPGGHDDKSRFGHVEYLLMCRGIWRAPSCAAVKGVSPPVPRASGRQRPSAGAGPSSRPPRRTPPAARTPRCRAEAGRTPSR